GRGFAIAGVSIASVILLLMGSIVGAALAFVCFEHSPRNRGQEPELIERHSLPVQEGDHIAQLAYSADGSRLLCRAQEAGLSLWNASSGEKLWEVPAEGRDYHFTPGG